MKRLSVLFVFLFGTAVFAVAGCSTTTRFVPGSALEQPSAVRNSDGAHAMIPLVKNTVDKAGFHLVISVGGGSPSPVLFDTGSTGLWIYHDRLPKGTYTDLHVPASNTYVSGIVYQGTLVESTVTFGKGLTTDKVVLVRVAGASCVAGSDCAKDCAGYKSIIRCLEQTRGLDGTFGAALEPTIVSGNGKNIAIFNVIFGIHQPWASVFVVKPPQLLLGPVATPGFTLVRMSPGPTIKFTMPSGAKSWRKSVPVCYTIVGKGVGLRHYCVDSLFDTGETGMSFSGFPKPVQTVATSCGNLLPAGAEMTAVADGATIAHFELGYRQNLNEVVVKPLPTPSGSPYVNSGLTFYNRDEILFDGAAGLTGLRPLAKPVQNFVTTCVTPTPHGEGSNS